MQSSQDKDINNCFYSIMQWLEQENLTFNMNEHEKKLTFKFSNDDVIVVAQNDNSELHINLPSKNKKYVFKYHDFIWPATVGKSSGRTIIPGETPFMYYDYNNNKKIFVKEVVFELFLGRF